MTSYSPEFGTLGTRHPKQPEMPGELVHPAKHRNEAKANERRLAFLAEQPRGERDIESLVEERAQARREREEWLRGVLSACED